MVTARDCSDDKVEEGHLSDGFDLTCRAWDVSLFVLHNTCVSTYRTLLVSFRDALRALRVSVASTHLLK